MIEVIDDLAGPFVGLRVHGTVTAADYEDVAAPEITAALARHDRLRVLYVLADDFDGYTLGAVWDDARLGGRGRHAWERVAVVTDTDWVRGAVRAFGWMIPGEVRVFREEPPAREWLTG